MWMACTGQESIEKKVEVPEQPMVSTDSKSNPKSVNGVKIQGAITQGVKGPDGMNVGPQGPNGNNLGPKGPPPNLKGGQVANGSGGVF
jgi:hypothetical protein